VWLIVKGFSPKLQPTAPKPRAEALHPVWTSQHQLASRAAESRATLPATSTAPLIAIDNVGASDRAPADGPSRRFPSRVPLRATGACPPRCPRTATNNQRSPPATCEHEASVPSLHDCLGRVRRVKAKPLCGRFASLDTPHTARGMGTYRGDGGKVAHGGRRSGWQFNAVPRQYEAASQGMSVQPELIRTVTIRAANAVDRTAQKYSNVPEQPPAAPSGSTLSLLGRRPNAQQRR
jgi:hypothetical protein